jgi:hypothetical protein
LAWKLFHNSVLKGHGFSRADTAQKIVDFSPEGMLLGAASWL